MQLSIYNQSMFLHKHLSFTVPIVSKSNPYLEIVPVLRSSDFVPPLPWYHIFVLLYLTKSNFEIPNKVEEVNECLLIASIEISCWKEQLKQASKSIPYTNHFPCNSNQFLLVILANQI